MELGAFGRRYATAVAVLLGCSGAVFTYASFDDRLSAECAVLALVPSAALVLALPGKKHRKKKAR